MSERRENCLTIAADNYCEYMLGYSVCQFGLEQAQILTCRDHTSQAATLMAAELMYGGASKMVDAGLDAIGGVRKDVTKLSHEGIDDDIAAFATDAVELAHDKFAGRIARIGEWGMTNQVLRPCVLKTSRGAYMVRRSRIDKLTTVRLSEGVMHEDLVDFGTLSLSELRKTSG